MLEITSENAAEYLRNTGRIDGDELAMVEELSGGVSNVVLLVTLPRRGERFVIKQARGRLRVQEEWLCPVERIWREVDVLRICGELLETRSADCGVSAEDRQAAAPFEPTVPLVFWEDRDNFLYAMTAAPEEHRTWKEMLLEGDLPANAAIATSCGRLLAQLHAAAWGNVKIAARLNDRAYFDQLRLDPYYRQVARMHPDLKSHIDRLVESVWQHRCCLAHGDFSPKNLLVWPGNVMLIDFEVGHYGDPAFDLGFFLTHLVLKSVWSGPREKEYWKLTTAFWTAYQERLAGNIPADELAALEGRALWNLAGCLLARVDGKSPVEYLSATQRQVVRNLARNWVSNPPVKLAAAIESLATMPRATNC